MRFHLGSIPDDFQPDSSWRSIREPGPVVLQVLALPVGLGAALVFGYCWQVITEGHGMRLEGSNAPLWVVALALSFPVLVVIHELLHAIVHPHYGRSPDTVIGAWPSRLLFFAHYCGPLSRNRFLGVFIMPFLVISLLPLSLAALGGLPSGAIMWAAWFSIWNAFFACGDYIGFVLIASQIPPAAIVQNKGWRTYWRFPEEKAV